jgi:Fe-S-cluster containining protein
MRSITDGSVDLPAVSVFLRKFRQGSLAGNNAVPCNGCSACCRNYYDVTVRPEDDQELETVERNGRRVLPVNADGECHYLVNGQCSIYARRPTECRVFDCRTMAYSTIRLNGRPLLNAALDRWRLAGAVRTAEDRQLMALVVFIAHLLQANTQLKAEAVAELACLCAPAILADVAPLLRAIKSDKPGNETKAARLIATHPALLRAVTAAELVGE